MKTVTQLIISSFTLIALLSLTGYSQSFEGKVTFGITYDLPADQQQYASMMPNEHVFFIKNELTRMDQNVMGNQSTMIHDNSKGSSIVLIVVQGMKYKMTMDDNKDEVDYNLEYLSETKNILGYSCKKARVKMDEGETIIYYTNELPSPKLQGMGKLDGFPMEYTVTGPGMKIHYVAKSVNEESVADSMFTIPDDYQEMPTDMMKMFGFN